MTNEAVSADLKKNTTRALVALVVVGALISFNIWYTARSQRIADARWCELVTSLDDRWRALPNPAPEARNLSITLTDLRKRLECSLPQPVQTDPSPASSAVRSPS